MMEKISYIPHKPIIPVSKGQNVHARNKTLSTKGTENHPSFDTVLNKTITNGETIKFSGHAQERLKSRNIQFSEEQMERITGAFDRAARKGAQDALFLVDNVAAVVSVKNRTVITVVDEAAVKDNVFTNIDSTVIV